MMTIRELRTLLAPYDDDLPVEAGIIGGEAGTQREVIDVTYATGTGRCERGGSAIIIEFGGPPESSEEEVGEDDLLTCPFCDKVIEVCPHCNEEL